MIDRQKKLVIALVVVVLLSGKNQKDLQCLVIRFNLSLSVNSVSNKCGE